MAPVDLKGFYAYLLWSREALWRALEGVSEEALERPLVPRKRLKSVKALLLHTAVVEDAWLHEDILRAPMVLAGFPEVEAVLEREGEGLPLRALRAYQEAVGRATWAFLQGPVDENQVVALHDAPEERYSWGTSSGTPSCTRCGTWLRWFFCCAFWGWSLPLWTSTFS
jgi:uncharacterized damage-inducible protein DinB